MERLTYKITNIQTGDVLSYGLNSGYNMMLKGIQKLGEYEDAEEQGLLLRLPFKIGQKVYYIYESCIDKSLMIGSMVYSYSCLDFPREYFSTKEEAEQALKDMQGV